MRSAENSRLLLGLGVDDAGRAARRHAGLEAVTPATDSVILRRIGGVAQGAFVRMARTGQEAQNDRPLSHLETPMPDTVPKETATYDEALQALSQLDFETAALDGDLPPAVDAGIALVAQIFKRDELAVLDDLEAQRAAERREQEDDDELRYGHLNQCGETPEEAAANND